MPKTPHCPPRRTPPKLEQRRPGDQVAVWPAIINTLDPSLSADTIAYYRVAPEAVIAIKEVGQRELYEALIKEVEREKTYSSEMVHNFLRYKKTRFEERLETQE